MADEQKPNLTEEFQQAWDAAPMNFTFNVDRRVAEYWWVRGRRAEIASLSADIERKLDASSFEPMRTDAARAI